MLTCVLLSVASSWLRRLGRAVDWPDWMLCKELKESVSITTGVFNDCANNKAVSSPVFSDVLSVIRFPMLTSSAGMLTADDTLPSVVFDPSVTICKWLLYK